MNYIPRLADQVLADRLEAKGAVLIEGPKWCGKTTTSKQIAKSVIEMDHPVRSVQYKEMAEINPGLLLEGDNPRLIDEWQVAKKLWNAIRYEVDRRNEFGQFILTGSAVPPEYDESMHSGTGRISRMMMRPMSLYESGNSNGQVSLKELFAGKSASAVNGHDIQEIAFLICRGGWPRAIGASERVALRQAIDYFDAVVNVDISRTDGVRRDPEKAKRLLRSYARNLASQTPLETYRSDMDSNDPVSNDTLYSYLSVLRRLFVLEDTPAWNPNLRSKTAIRTTDTRYFTDPSVAAAALGIGPQDLINDLNTMGLFFENLCIRDLRVYADVLDGTVYHYRDKSGLECDAVLHLRNGQYGLIEIKLGGDKLIQEGVETLRKLTEKIDIEKMNTPSFRMVLTGNSPYAYQREDGIVIVPVGCLKP